MACILAMNEVSRPLCQGRSQSRASCRSSNIFWRDENSSVGIHDASQIVIFNDIVYATIIKQIYRMKHLIMCVVRCSTESCLRCTENIGPHLLLPGVNRIRCLILTSFALIIATIPIQDPRTFFASTVYTITGIHRYKERMHSRMLNTLYKYLHCPKTWRRE